MKAMLALAALTTLSLGSIASAGPVIVDFASTQSVRGLDSFTGTAAFDASSGTLTLDITNTSKAPLTAFSFETETGVTATYERAAKSHWKNEPNKKGVVNARPFGKYDAGAAVGGHWGSLAGKKGLAAGATGEFFFDIKGPTASSLTTSDFFLGTTRPQIVASFAGIKHHKPDKAEGFGHVVTTDSVTPPGSNTPISDTPIDKTTPPYVPPKGGGTIPTGGDKSPTVSAVPLPPAAPVGFITLGIFGCFAIVRKVGKIRL